MNSNLLIAAVGAVALGGIFWFGSIHKPVVPGEKPAVTEPVKPNDEGAKVIFHRVGEGGKQGEETKCKSITPFTEGKSAAELAAAAKRLGVTVEDLKRYYVCNQD